MLDSPTPKTDYAIRNLKRVKNHLKRNRWTYVFAILSTLLWNGHNLNAKRYDSFLTEKGIDPREFWLCEEDYLSEIQ